jgi:glucose/arabinose dehydrogenase
VFDAEPPVQKLGAHVAAIGFTFYTGDMFPAKYKNAAIIAEHGSWNRSTPSGYRVMAAFTDGRRAENFDVFDFELSSSELAAIDALDTAVRRGPEPDQITLESFRREIPEA